MSVKRRLNTFSGIRLDIPYLRSIESAVSYDFDSVLRGLVTGTSQPYLIRGFDIVIPSASTHFSTLQISVSDAAVLHSSATESGTILAVPVGTANDLLDSASSSKMIGSFSTNATNYIGLDYRRTVDTSTTDQASAWSASQQIEYQRSAPLGKLLDYRYVINTTGFGTNLPLYIVLTASNGNVLSITKSVPSLFRLGSGGSVPDPLYRFDYQNLINAQTGTRREWISPSPTYTSNPVSVQPGNPSSAFNYGDWSITTLKEWMDAIMTRFVETTGSAYWYTDSGFSSGAPVLSNTWWDSIGSVMTGVGNLSFNYILEATKPSEGGFQTSLTDTSVLAGDSYIVDALTDSRASLNSFSNTTLVINTLTSNSFTYGGVLYNRRLMRHNPGLFKLAATWVDGSNTYAQMTRIPTGTPNIAVPSWAKSGPLSGATVTVDTTGAHGYKVGDLIDITGLTVTGGATPPNGVQYVTAVTSGTQFKFISTLPLGGGVTGVSTALTCKDPSQVGHPYTHTFLISSWSYVAPYAISLTVPGHNLIGTPNILVSGLSCTTNAPNGGFQVTSIVNDTINFTALSTPTGTPVVVAPATVKLTDSHSFDVTVTGATPLLYNVIDAPAISNSIVDFSYPIGDELLPTQPDASGAIVYDGIVAESTVVDPLRINTITYGTGTITITTFNNHGLTGTTTGTVFTVYGDPTITGYAQTFTGVTLTYNPGGVAPKVILLTSGTVSDQGSYTNTSTTDDIFASNPDNPYPGPIQWDSDIIIKGVIGDKSFTIPQIATATPALANRFNVNGLSGTAFLQDGEVAYIELERNQSVSSGTQCTCAGPTVITTSVAPIDIHGNSLQAGDFVKFDDEPESYWLRILSVVGSTLNLITDRGIVPTVSQRPAKAGRLVYCKGIYSIVSVAPHWEVPNNADVYWLAVRRDNNGGTAKAYLKALELRVGETRTINNQTPDNLLVYTGAMVDSATNPNYTLADTTGSYQYSESLTVLSKDDLTQMVTFVAGPALGFEIGDAFIQTPNVFIVEDVITTRTVVVQQATTALTTSAVTYHNRNYNISDSDNLTLAIRKEDRELGKVNTTMSKAIYDESVYCQQINLGGTGVIKSGDYIYTGSATAPSALAWVLHGTAAVPETIEGTSIPMPGSVFGPNSILVHIVSGTFGGIGSGTFRDTDPINQFPVGATARTIDNAGDPDFTAPVIPDGTGLVLPPNQRTQVTNGSTYLLFGAHAAYSASTNAILSGENLLVIVNDTIRQASLDYVETFGGPKGYITVDNRDWPANTRIRFRVLNNYGSLVASIAGSSTLQTAYNMGQTIGTMAGVPVVITAGNSHTALGDTSLELVGSLVIDGDAGGLFGIVNGIFPLVDQGMLIGKESLKPLETWTAEQFIKTHTAFTGSAWVSKTAATTTTVGGNAVPNDSIILIPLNSVVRVTATLVARDDTNAGSASFRLEATFKRAAGSASLVGSPVTTINGADGAGLLYAAIFETATITIADDAMAIRVYGDGASGTVNWAAAIDYQVIS